MAAQATALYRKFSRLLRVPAAEARGLADGVRIVATAQESTRLAGARTPAVVISASGMATGGRVLQHLKTRAPDARNAIVLAGFQVGGSRGARLLAGEREIKIFGGWVPVRAEVSQLAGFSAHADRSELIAWMRHIKAPPRQTWVVHGEPDAADGLRVAVQRELGWAVRVPHFGQSVTTDGAP